MIFALVLTLFWFQAVCACQLSCNRASFLSAILGCYFRGVVFRFATFLRRVFLFGFLDVQIHRQSIPSSQEPRCVRKRERLYKNKEENAVRKPGLKHVSCMTRKKLWRLSFMARVSIAGFFKSSTRVFIRQVFFRIS